MLSAEQARVADDAIAAVRAAVAKAKEAIDAEWVTLTWLTGSESAAAARREDLRQSEKILAMMISKRPTLDENGLVGFVQLGSAGAQVDALIESAKRMTAEGFKKEVVDPTLHDLNPLNLSGPIGKTLLLAGLAFVAFTLLTRSK